MERDKEINIKKLLLKFLWENKTSIIAYLIFTLAVPLANIYLPHLYGKIVSTIKDTKSINRQVKMQFAMIFTLWIIIQIAWLVMNTIDSYFIPKLNEYVREKIVNVILETYKEDFQEKELGGIMREIVKLPDDINHAFSNIRYGIVPMVYIFVVALIYFMWTNPLLGVSAIIALCLCLGIAYVMIKKALPVWQEMDDSNRTLHGEINDTLGNLLSVYTLNQEKEEKARLAEYEKDLKEKQGASIRCAGNFRISINIFYIILFCGVNIVSFYLFSKQKIGLDRVISILVISLELIAKIAGFVGAVDKIMYELSTVNNIQRVLNTLSERGNTRIKLQQEMNRNNLIDIDLYGDIVFENIIQSFNNKNNTLDSINLNIPHGKKVLIIGEIGSGKTTLINVLVRLLPFKGNVYINGYNTRDIKLEYLREHIAYVPQNPKLFNRSVYENISYANGASREQVLTHLNKYNINLSLDESVGKWGSHLSGGQRQIIYLLRVLFKDTPIVVLDEPTSSLDSESKERILTILGELFVGKTVIIISHDKDVYKYVDAVIKMNKGRVV